MILFLVVITVLSNLLIAILSLARDRKSHTNVLLSVFSILIAIWTLTNYLSSHSETPLIWVKAVMIISSFLVLIIVLFSKTFPEEKANTSHKNILFVAGASVCLAILSCTNFIFSNATLENGILSLTPGPGISLFFVYFVYGISLTLFNFFKKYHQSSGRMKAQLKLLLYSFFITFALVFFTNFILVNFFALTNAAQGGPFFSLILVGTVFYSIVKYRFLDIRMTIRRGIIGLVTHSSLLIIGLILNRTLIQELSTLGPLPTALILIPLTGLLYSPIHHTTTSLVDKTFFRLELEKEKKLKSIPQVLGNIPNLTELRTTSTRLIKSIFNAQKIKILLANKSNEYLSYDKIMDHGKLDLLYTYEIRDTNPKTYESFLLRNIEVVSTLKIGDNIQGYIIYSRKKTDEVYSSNECKEIELMNKQLSIIFKNAAYYQEIQDFNTTLQKKIDIATTKLRASNKELKDLYDNLEDLYQKEKDLMDIAGHELRTPASILKNNLYLLENRLKQLMPNVNDEKVKKYLSRLVESTDRQIRLINTFLESARIENKQFGLNIENADFTELITKAVEDSTYLTKEKKLKLIYTPPTKKMFIDMDSVRVREVIDNLLSNAIKYTHEGYVEVKISETADTVSCSLTDTGIGISEKDIPSLFKKFSRVETHILGSETKLIRPGGTGLGLYVSKNIVDAHKGKITIESKPGKGSTFTFEIPKNQEKSAFGRFLKEAEKIERSS